MSVSFDEIETSPKGGFKNGIIAIYRQGVTNWSDITAFMQELMPPTTTFGTGAGQFYGAALPGNDLYRVVDFEWKPLPSGALRAADIYGINTFEKAFWDITYQVPKFTSNEQPQGDPVGFLTHEWTTGGEFLVLPNTSVSWDPPEQSVRSIVQDVQAGIFVPTIEQSVTWERVKNPPFAAIRSSIGKVNASAFPFRTGTAAAETVLFTGAHLSQQIMTDGARAWKVTYKFSERNVPAEDQSTPGGWNHFWRNQRSSSGFYKLYKSRTTAGQTGSFLTYIPTNLALLFQAGS